MLLFVGAWAPALPEYMRLAVRRLSDAGLLGPVLVEDLQLVLTELLTNAARAGAGTIAVSSEALPAATLIEVTDDGPGLPTLGFRPAPDDATGRGLHIVSALAEEWGWRGGDGHTKTVWARLGPGSGLSAP